MKYGVKLTAIDVMDYDDLNQIAQKIKELGYKIEVVDNGNFVCFKEVKEWNMSGCPQSQFCWYLLEDIICLIMFF